MSEVKPLDRTPKDEEITAYLQDFQQSMVRAATAMIPHLQRMAAAVNACGAALERSGLLRPDLCDDTRWPLHGDYMREYYLWREAKGLNDCLPVARWGLLGPFGVDWDE